MSRLKRNRAGGVITFHTPVPDFLLKSEESAADVQAAPDGRQGPPQLWSPVSSVSSVGKSEGPSPSEAQPHATRPWLSPTPLRRLQARIEAEKAQAKEIIQSLLDAKNELMEESEDFLSQWDVEELKRKEGRHKSWTEDVWLPCQRRVEEHVSKWGPAEVERRQRLYSHFLHYGNVKVLIISVFSMLTVNAGFVFLDIYDLGEYNPFLLKIKQPHDFQLSRAEFKDQMYPKQRDMLTENRTRECDCKHLYSSRPSSESVASHTRAPLHHPASASRQSPALGVKKGQMRSRFDDLPHHISAGAVADARCCRPDCGFSR